jgi:hypothetical protein
VQVPWRVIEPLPDGGELSVERARLTVEVGWWVRPEDSPQPAGAETTLPHHRDNR